MSNIEVVTADPAPEPVAAPVPETNAPPPAEEGAQPQADAPASETDATEQPEGDHPKEPKPRGWVSTRINELTAEKHAERRRADEAIAAKATLEAELAALKGSSQPAPRAPVTEVDPFDPASLSTFVQQQIADARKGWEADQQAKSFETKRTEFTGKISETNEGAQRLLTDTSFPLTSDMAEFIVDSPDGVAVADYLGLNPAESARIASLSPTARGVELARLEARLTAPQPKPAPKPTNAPPPAPTVGARAVASANPETMTQAQYEAWRQSQAAKRS